MTIWPTTDWRDCVKTLLAKVYLLWILLSPLAARSQTLSLASGTQIYGGLTNTTVTLAGRCELRITNSVSPIPGCLINLNSSDAFFVMQSIKPSVVVASYLSQFRVNGAAAVADSNCRVVQYGVGAIVLPHAPSFQPLTVYSGPHFTGSSMQLNQYVYYKGAGLGAFNGTISSFKLKRGYLATLAQNENGTGISQCYIAQDGDMEVSVLPDAFDDSVRFIYVLPWRWTSKKGIAGNIEGPLNVQWKYNWNIDQNSTRDLEYVPIRQDRWWPGLGQNWQTRGACQLLGYNEPDKSDQANIAVGDAIWSWPDLLATGLRVGSPASSDGGWSSWLYPFMAQADAANLRVDFVAVHYYQCHNPSDASGAASQMYNALKSIYDTVKRPLWITEWNNGANWTTCGDPSYAQQQACISAMTDMLENTPFVERYAPYNWVEDVRRLEWDDGSLTAAGTTYRDRVSNLAYVQALQDNETRSFAQLRFETNTLDTSGYGNNGITSGSPGYANGHSGQAMVFDGANTVVTLPPNVATGSAFTFAGWIYWNGGANWQRIFDFGNSTTQYLFLTPKSDTGTLRFGIKNGGSTQMVETGALAQNQWQHVAVTLSGNTARLYVNGALAASNTGMSITPASFSPRVNFLGKSQYTTDPKFGGLMDEVLITDYALSAAQIASLQTNTPPTFTNSLFARGSATEGLSYSNTIAGTATDPDAGDTLTYSKAIGPAWLSVAANGTMTGTPTSADGGTNYITVRVTDSAGQNAYALVSISVTTITASGAWIADTSANWSESNRWTGSTVATGVGQTADFSTINITGNRTVTLDSSRTIGTLKFGDTSGSQAWTIAASSNYSLKLDTGSATSPSLMVTNVVTISAPVGGTNGFLKSGPGMLVLSGNNSLSGTVYLDTNSQINDGITRLIGPDALANASAISIRNNNAGNSTFQLDGTLGSITVNAQVSATYRNNAVVTIQNLAGTNIFNGDILLYQGGNSFTVQSDSGMVVFTGSLMYVGGLAGIRTNYFTGVGDQYVIGPIVNSTNGSPISLAKSGSGRLTLGGVNTYTNGTYLNGGTMIVNGTLPAGLFTIAGGAVLGGNGVIYPAVTVPSTATLAPGASVGQLTVNNSVTLQAGSTTRMELDKSLGTNDQLRVTGALTYGGTLVVTNLGGTLWAGDAFKLFDAPSYSGAFAATNLPALSGGLVWRFNPANGVLMVTQPGVPGFPPAAPTALAALGGGAIVNLTWVQSATTDVITNRIYRSTTGIGGPYNPLANLPATTAYSDTGVVNGQTYHYVVTAISTNGESVWSSYASASPQSLQPYVADTNTLILFHFDEPAGTSGVTNYGTLSVTTANKKAYAVDQTSSTTAPPLVTTILGASAYPGFGSAANLTGANGPFIGWDANNSGAYDADAGAAAVDAVSLSTLNMGNGGQSPWTMEAMIYPTNTTASQPRNSEIICTDSSAAVSRGFQFRLTTSGKLELNFISSTSGGAAQQLADIPTSGPHAYAPSNWFHVAAAYDGANVNLYWTKVGAGLATANLLTNYPLTIGTTFGAVTGPLVVGGENRNANSETFPGWIDEVRLSSVARGATNFLWLPGSVPPNAPLDLSATAGDTQAALSWSASFGATSYNLKRVSTNGVYYTTITNVSTTTLIDTGLVNGTVYYYVVSALNSAGESINSAQASVRPVSMAPANLTFVTSTSQWQLNWPADHVGWHVETNAVDLADTNFWFTLPGSTATNQVFLNLDPAQTNVFFRLKYP